jgi:hypothetical protein
MATSTNYGWAEPDNSSLVKNGASDIRTLGNAIDTSVWNVGYGQAGKNKIINGDFGINQRAFSTTTTTGTFGLDRWFLSYSGGTVTYSAQSFTPGTAPVAGYESTTFARMVSASQSAAGDYATLQQKIENVRTYAGQTITYSFWAKASTGTPNVGITLVQNFGAGGSAGVVTSPAVKPITTSWARYSFNVNVPSVSGKTIGVGSALESIIFTSNGATLQASGYAAVGVQNATIDIWGVQAEYGSIATPFQTATGTIQGELAACQRYYYRATPGGSYAKFGDGKGYSTGYVQIAVPLPVTMRTTPSSIETSAMNTFQWETGATAGQTPTSITIETNCITPNAGVVNVNKTGTFTVGAYYWLTSFSTTSSYVGFSAEL